MNPHNTIYSIKRFMGRLLSEVTNEAKQVPYKVVAGKDGRVEVEVAGERHTPEQISAMVLQKLKTDAEAYLGEKVTDAVITVPAYFNDAQRQATKNAGQIAGLNVLRIINEPTAASLAYGLEKKENEKILVFDLGGGTFDVSILEVGEGVFEVKSTNGDTHLGGDDYDRRVVDWLADEFKRDQGIDLRGDPQALQRLTEAAEKAKIELSQRQETQVNLPFITADASGPKHLDIALSRSKFEQLTEDLSARCRKPFQDALADAHMSVKDLDEVILVGGSTRMPVIQALVKELTGKDANRGRQPRRGGGGRRRHPGRRAQGRGQGRPAPRRHPAARSGSRPRARSTPSSSTATPPSRPPSRRSSPPPPTPSRAWRSSSSRASGRWRGTTGSWAHSPWMGSRRRRAACPRSRSPSTSTPTASSTSPPMTGAPASRTR